MRTFLLLITSLLYISAAAQDVPYKPEEEFTIRLDLKFLTRPAANPSTVNLSESREEYLKRTSNTQLPYLTLFITIKEANQEESRIKILRDGKTYTNVKKLELGKEFKLDIGYTDDAKDKVSGYSHIIYFLTKEKKEINKIVITIEENGDYLINGERRGRL